MRARVGYSAMVRRLREVSAGIPGVELIGVCCSDRSIVEVRD